MSEQTTHQILSKKSPGQQVTYCSNFWCLEKGQDIFKKPGESQYSSLTPSAEKKSHDGS